MNNKILGRCACPLCGCPDQEVRETAKNNPKPYLCCEECQAQIFARGPKSARILRGMIGRTLDHLRALIEKIMQGSATAKPAQPAIIKAPEAQPPAAPVAPVAAAPSPEPEPAERTIFDWFKAE